jgi:hypothetical protein
MFSASKSGFELLQVMRLRRWTQNKGILKRWNIRAQRSQRVRKIREEAWTIAVILQDTRQEPATDLYDSERKHTRSTRNWSLSIHFREIHRFGHIRAIDPRFRRSQPAAITRYSSHPVLTEAHWGGARPSCTRPRVGRTCRKLLELRQD